MESSLLIKAAIFIGIVVLVLMASAKKRADAKALKRRIERLKNRKTAVQKNTSDTSLRRKTTEKHDLAFYLLKPFPDSKRMASLLERAGKNITPKQFIFRRALSVLGIAMVFAFIGWPVYVAVAIGVVLGLWLPFRLLKRSINKQSQEFLRSFPEAIDLIVRGLRSGLPVSESIVLVSHELPEPLKSVFTTISNTMKLGVPLEKALLETAKRLELREFYFFTTSIVLQRETGGNLSEILNNLGDVLRTRFMMKMKIHALTSEARASTAIIGALPFVVTLAVSLTSPDYLKPLWQTPGGIKSLCVAACMMGFGLWSMNRMAQFEI